MADRDHSHSLVRRHRQCPRLVYSGLNESLVTAHLSVPLQVFLSVGCVPVKPSTEQSSQITSDRVFFVRPRPRRPPGFSISRSQPSLRSTWPCHLSQQVRITFFQIVKLHLLPEIYLADLVFGDDTAHPLHHSPVIALEAMQVRWVPGSACMEHGTPYECIVKSSSGGDGKEGLNLPHTSRRLVMVVNSQPPLVDEMYRGSRRMALHKAFLRQP